MRANNLTLLTDLYELTMMQGYFKNPTNQTVIFDMILSCQSLWWKFCYYSRSGIR